jgi:hypothetical protein
MSIWMIFRCGGAVGIDRSYINLRDDRQMASIAAIIGMSASSATLMVMAMMVGRDDRAAGSGAYPNFTVGGSPAQERTEIIVAAWSVGNRRHL